jgi:c-di-GMP-binding flagellar brake protein YcgR
MGIEAKRRHKRVPLAAYVTLTFEEGGKELSLEAMTADISLSGIGLYVGRQIQEDTALTVEINFVAAADQVNTETLRGRVVYANYIRRAYFIGVEFLEELNPKSHPGLYTRLQNILRLG